MPDGIEAPERGKRIADVDRQVGARVKALRVHLKMSQSTLAAKIGVTFQQVQKYEKGANRIGASRLQRIAEALGVGVSTFFESSDDGVGIDLGEYVRISDPALRLRITRLVEAFEHGSAPSS